MKGRRLGYPSKVEPLSAAQVRVASLQGPRACDSRYLDVWLLSSKLNAEQREIYEGVLSNDERARARRFVFEEDRARCITARGGLRWLLSSYCGMNPDELRFQTGDHGKPSLHKSPVQAHFNASHSGEYVLIGITAEAECGVDVELPRSNRSELDIAERFLARAKWSG